MLFVLCGAESQVQECSPEVPSAGLHGGFSVQLPLSKVLVFYNSGLICGMFNCVRKPVLFLSRRFKSSSFSGSRCTLMVTSSSRTQGVR
jgi:hypothetical protein